MFVTLLKCKYFINRLNSLKLFNRLIKKITRVMDVETDVGCSPGLTSTSSVVRREKWLLLVKHDCSMCKRACES